MSAKRRVLKKPLFRTEVNELHNVPSNQETGRIQRRCRKRLGGHRTLAPTPSYRDDDGGDDGESKRHCLPDQHNISSLTVSSFINEEENLLSGLCPEDLNFSFNASLNATPTTTTTAANTTTANSTATAANTATVNTTTVNTTTTANTTATVNTTATAANTTATVNTTATANTTTVTATNTTATVNTTATANTTTATVNTTATANTTTATATNTTATVNTVINGVSEVRDKEKDTFFGLPLLVMSLLKEYRGIQQLYAWQEQCLYLPHVLSGGNIIYTLPTSGGKTLVAEILILRQLILYNKDVLLILPYVSIVQEKVRDMAPFASALGFAVEEYAGSKGKTPPIKRRRKRVIYVATIEKANGLVNSLAELKRLDSIGLVVVDELHMLGDGSVRGATLEVCLTKVICISSGTQMVGMSATLSNTTDLATFLRAEIYSSEFRPVELKEYVKLGRCVYSVKMVRGEVSLLPERDIQSPHSSKSNSSSVDSDDVISLVNEVIPHSSCLVFCATKKLCQNVALLLAKHLPRFHSDLHAGPRSMLLKSLAIEAQGMCPVLARTVPMGVAYHHSGLTSDERHLIEDGYSRGELNVLCCTSTLAAGVNLPARRVILRSPYIGREYITHSQYKQMIGRAGRKGLTEYGESILIAKETDKHKVLDMLSSPYDRCNSSLLCCHGNTTLASFLLSLIGLKLASTTSDLQSFLKTTFYYQQSRDHTHFLACCQDTVANLVAKGYITMETTTSRLIITSLGRATVKGCVPVQNAANIYRELSHAQSSLILSNNLHLLYLATPTDHTPSIRPNWLVFFQRVTGLNNDEMKVAELIGISPALLSKLATGSGGDMSEDISIRYHRFYLSLMMYSLISESGAKEAWSTSGGVAKKTGGVWSVADQYQCSRGLIQSAITSVASFATCLVHFTKEIPELWALHQLLPSVAQQLSYSATSDLIPLMEIPGVRQGRARQLFQVGYTTPESIATLTPTALCEYIDHLYIKQARRIIQGAKSLLKEKAELLFEEAENLMAHDRPTITL